MNISDCKGCASERYVKDHVKHTICSMNDVRKNSKLFDKVTTCPCSICLVKGMCETECDKFIHYISKYSRIIKQEEN